ncbi:MAG TPA: hypothetical protein VLA43_02325, partial [Longimicrobiales bacterium]|nr:hypothetical protein [Longimicrobiales bacterium]
MPPVPAPPPAPPEVPPDAAADAPIVEPPEPENAPPSPTFRERAGRYWARHRTLFWMLHSFWALATGVAVLLLARERYAFVPWVVAFLGLTWASTL